MIWKEKLEDEMEDTFSDVGPGIFNKSNALVLQHSSILIQLLSNSTMFFNIINFLRSFDGNRLFDVGPGFFEKSFVLRLQHYFFTIKLHWKAESVVIV